MRVKFFLALFLIASTVSVDEKQITFKKLLQKAQLSGSMKVMAVAGADNPEILASCDQAKKMKIADSILVGPKAKIEKMAADIKMDLSSFEIVDIEDPVEVANYAVKLVHDGKADMYMKGSVETKFFLKAILNKEFGLYAGKPITLVAVFEVEGLKKMIFLTDPAVMVYPTLEDKVKIIANAVDVVKACGIETPKVAPLATVEVVNPKMPCTVEAKQLTEMNERGEIKGCIIDGPLSLDLAIDEHAAILKKIDNRKIRGDADILLFPDIHGANFSYKLLTHTSKSLSGNILAGTSQPCILTSRGDSAEVKLNSIILASVYAEYLQGKKDN